MFLCLDKPPVMAQAQGGIRLQVDQYEAQQGKEFAESMTEETLQLIAREYTIIYCSS